MAMLYTDVHSWLLNFRSKEVNEEQLNCEHTIYCESAFWWPVFFSFLHFHMLSNIQADWQMASVQGRGNFKNNTHLFYRNFFFRQGSGG